MRKLMLASLVASALMLPAITLQAQDSYGSSANRDRAAASTDKPMTATATTKADKPMTATATTKSDKPASTEPNRSTAMAQADCVPVQSTTHLATKPGNELATTPPIDCDDLNHGQVVSQTAHDAKAAGKPVGKTVREVAKSDVGKRHTTTTTASTDYTGMSSAKPTTSTNKQVATTKSSKDRAQRENTRNLQSEEQQKEQQKDDGQY